MILLGLLSEPNRDLLKEFDSGVCCDLLMVTTFKECVIGAEEATAVFMSGSRITQALMLGVWIRFQLIP